MSAMQSSKRPRTDESGFTLIEALVAMVILAVGLVAVANLLVVGATSNTIGNHSTNTTTIARETMERLRNISFELVQVSPAGSIDATPTCDDNVIANNCVRPDNFQAFKNVQGVGQVQTTWEIVRVDNQTLFIRVRSDSNSALARRRARAEFTTMRSCTAVSLGCPAM